MAVGQNPFNWGGAISGISGLLTALFPDTTTQNGSQNTSGTTSGATSGTTTPTPSALQSMLQNMFGAGAMNQFQNIPGVVKATEEGGLQNINAGQTAAQEDVSNTLAARGLAYSPYAGTAMAQPAIAGQQQKSQLLTSLPLLQQQLESQDIGQLINAEGATGPMGSTTTGTTNLNTTGASTSQQSTTNQGILGNLFSGL